jgi:large subunit ribosomal protein L9
LKVILTKYHEKLGDVGDEVEVKSGYANNYLIPNGLAVPFTKGNVNQMKLIKKAVMKAEARNIKEAEELVEKLGSPEITFIVKTGEEGKLYGSITNKDIADKILEEKKVEIDKKKIDLQEHIKELGVYDIDLKLYKDIKATLKVKVEPDEESKQLIEARKAEIEKEEGKKREIEKEEEKKKPVEAEENGKQEVESGRQRAKKEKIISKGKEDSGKKSQGG